MLSDMAFLKCNTTNIGKRKLSCEHLISMDNGSQNMYAKRRRAESDGSNTQNNSFPTVLQLLVLNGEWNTAETVPSIIGERRSLTLPNIHALNYFLAPCSQSSRSEISTEDDDCTIKHCSETVERENTPITTHSDGEYKCINNAENNCDESLSWLINFEVGSLFKAAEEQHDHISEGKVEETTWSDSHVNVKIVQPSAKQMEANPSYSGSIKPPFTYTELIKKALQEKGELTTSGIYKWISEHFPYYKPDDHKWKNSVRHNLTVSPHFLKGSKAPHGAGHLWVLADIDKYFQTVQKMKQRVQKFVKKTVTTDEVQAATVSIQSNNESQDLHKELLLSIEADNSMQVQGISNCTPPPSPQQRVSLEQTAEEILSGVKKDVEVQYLVPVNEESLSVTDFLNPLSKEQVLEESGLLGQVDETGSTNLELTIDESDIMTLEYLLPDELDFQDSEFTSLPLELELT